MYIKTFDESNSTDLEISMTLISWKPSPQFSLPSTDAQILQVTQLI